MIPKNPEKKRWGDYEDQFKTFHHSFITVACLSEWPAASDGLSSDPLVPLAEVSWAEELLIVVLTACSQTGHYSPQPSTEMGYVGGRVWLCGEVDTTDLEMLQHYCHLYNWASLSYFLISASFFCQNWIVFFSFFLFFSPLFSRSATWFLSHILWKPGQNYVYCCFIFKCHNVMQQKLRQQEPQQLLCGFEKLH